MQRIKDDKNKNEYSPILWPNSSGKKKHKSRKAKENKEPSKLSLKFSKCLKQKEESEKGSSSPPKNEKKLKRRSSVAVFAKVYNALLVDDDEDAIPNTPSPQKLAILETPRLSLGNSGSIGRAKNVDSWRLSYSPGQRLGLCNKALSFNSSSILLTPGSILSRSGSLSKTNPCSNKRVSYAKEIVEIADTDDEGSDDVEVATSGCGNNSACGNMPLPRELFKSPLKNFEEYPTGIAIGQTKEYAYSEKVSLLEGSVVRKKKTTTCKEIILSSSSDDDDIPPPLSQRIQFNSKTKMTPESRTNTPVTEDSDEEFGKILEQMRTPRRKPVILPSDSESNRSYIDDSSSDGEPEKGFLPNKIPSILPHAVSAPTTNGYSVCPALHTKQPINTNRRTPAKVASCLQPTQSPRLPDATDADSFLKSLNKVAVNPHPLAEGYSGSNFKKRKCELVKLLYELFNTAIFENKLPSDMQVTWNPRMTKTAGYCYYRREPSAPEWRGARLELSEKVLDSADRVRDTLLHEMCHAASWIVNGYRDGHGLLFKYWGKKAKLAFPSLPVVSRCHMYAINTKYTYKCQGCGGCIGRHSKSLDMSRKVCSRCGGRFKLLINGKRASEMTPRNATPFALFVKENYGKIRSGSKGMKHAEVMKALSAEFAAKAVVKT